jgi:tripartite-type tricarboxylate transporter receptor subunit TctC
MRVFWAFSRFILLGISLSATAQEYPTKPVRFVVPYAPGGGLEVVGRPISQKLFELWGQPVLIDNRPGAGTTLGAALVAKAPPDGYTLLLTLSALTSGPGLYPKLPYDPVRDFAPVIWIATTSYVLSVHPSVPVKSVRELITLAQAKPGQLNYASSGQGSDPHLTAELFKLMTRTQMTHIPFSGGNPATMAVIGGQVDLSFLPTVSGTPFIHRGKLRGIAVSTPQRTAVFPNLPTISESGVPGYAAEAWSGLLAPAQTPRDIVARLNAAIAKIVHAPEMTSFLLARQTVPKGSTVEEFAARLRQDVEKKTQLIRQANIKVE